MSWTGKHPGGRPSKYTKKLGDQICEMIANGKSLRTIGKTLNFALSAFFRWIRENPEFEKQYARAKEEQSEALVEEMLDIADETSSDTITKIGKNGEEYEVQNSEWINRSRLRVDTRKWIASKLKPKKYGERLGLENADDSKPFTITIKKLNE